MAAQCQQCPVFTTHKHFCQVWCSCCSRLSCSLLRSLVMHLITWQAAFGGGWLSLASSENKHICVPYPCWGVWAWEKSSVKLDTHSRASVLMWTGLCVIFLVLGKVNDNLLHLAGCLKLVWSVTLMIVVSTGVNLGRVSDTADNPKCGLYVEESMSVWQLQYKRYSRFSTLEALTEKHSDRITTFPDQVK